METPKISVITLVYNTAAYLEQCLDSLFRQTLDGVEYILVDDCSPDNASEIIRQVLERNPQLRDCVKVIRHDKNRGAAAARNTGVQAATGTYTIHVDSDDWCEPQMLERLYRKAIETDADIVSCDYYVNYPKREFYQQQPVTDMCGQLLRGELHGALWNKLVKRELYNHHSIRFIPNVNVREDLIVVTQLSFFAGKMAYLPEAFLHYRVNPQSLTNRWTSRHIYYLEHGVDAVMRFFEEHDAQNKYEASCMLYKVGCKVSWLQHTRGLRQRVLMRKYPDADRYLSQSTNIPSYIRFAFHLARHNMFYTANAILRVIDWGRLLRARILQ